MEKLDNYVFSETLDIINHFEHELYKKIPKHFIDFLKDNSASDYKSSINFKKSINSQPIRIYTRAILAIVYREYICEKEEKRRLLLEEEEYFKKK